MNSDSKDTISGKILFGCDFIYIFTYLEYEENSENKYDVITGSVILIFLRMWGLTVNEITTAKNLLTEKINTKTLEDMNIVLSRIVKFIKNDKEAQEKLIIQAVAISALDSEVTGDENGLVDYFKDKFDYRASEFQGLLKRGVDWAWALNNLGCHYLESGLKIEDIEQ